MNSGRKAHWEQVYQDKEEGQTSWFQPRPETSLRLITSTGEPADAPFIDVGGGASRLVDHLLDQGWSNLSVLDISPSALTQAQTRLGNRAAQINWLETDLMEASLQGPYRIWHDRAVFHFLVEKNDRLRYLNQLKGALEAGGRAIIATFAPDGPEACSGLPVQRYSPESLQHTLGNDFRLAETLSEEHRTPAGATQSFIYCLFRYQP